MGRIKVNKARQVYIHKIYKKIKDKLKERKYIRGLLIIIIILLYSHPRQMTTLVSITFLYLSTKARPEYGTSLILMSFPFNIHISKRLFINVQTNS